MEEKTFAEALHPSQDWVEQQNQLVAQAKYQAEQQKALAGVIARIRQSLDLPTVFNTTAIEVRQLLSADRVAMFRFYPEQNWSGEFVSEDVAPQWDSAMAAKVYDHCFGNNFAAHYQQGRIQAVADIYNCGLSDCHVEILSRFQVRANLVVPLLLGQQLWGLLCIHQCSAQRHWETSEIEFVKQIAENLGIALQQAEYVQQVQKQSAQLALAAEREVVAQRQQTLAKTVVKIRQSLDLDIILRTTTEELRPLLKVDRVVIYRFNPDWSGEFIYESLAEPWLPLIQHQRQHPELCENISRCSVTLLADPEKSDTYLKQTEGGEFNRGEPFRICNDIYNANFSDCYIQALESYQARAYAIIAIYQGQKLWGLLAVYQNSQPREWENSEVDLLIQIGRQLGVALQQLEYLKQLQTQANQLTKASIRQRALATTVDKIRQSLDIDTIFKTTTQEVRQLLEVERVAIYRFNPDWSGEFVADSIIDGLVPMVTPQRMTNSELLQQSKTGQYPRNETFVPILQREKLWGLLVAYQNSAPRYWQEEEINLLAQVGVQLGVALQQAELLQQTQKQAQELTQTLEYLQRTQAQLIQGEKMASLGQLVAGVAHEINNPINFIYGNLSHITDYAENLLQLLKLYQENYPEPTLPIQNKTKAIDLDFIHLDFPKILASMEIGTDRIRDIVLSLRNFSRLDQADMKPVDIHEGIDSTLLILAHRLKPNAASGGIEVIREYGKLSLVECYPAQLNQVFMNILSNAIDALEEKLLKLQQTDIHGNTSLENPLIRISTELIDHKVLIRIADNGLGITERVKARLFDPFFTTKQPGKGTGLGLSISYQIVVEKHGGTLNCASQQGKGTEFRIEIPVNRFA